MTDVIGNEKKDPEWEKVMNEELENYLNEIREEARKEAREETRKEERENFAKRLLEGGIMSMEKIAGLAELPLTKVKELQDQLNA